MKSEFFEQLVRELRRTRLENLPAVVAAMRGGSGGGGGPVAVGSRESVSPEEIARLIVALEVRGSKLRVVESAVVLHALATCQGNVSAAARLLGIDRKAMERRLVKARRVAAGARGATRARASV